jgi:hypothetical protein
MPLMDTLMGYASKYGPTLLAAGQQILASTPQGRSTGMQGFMPGGGSPMGFAALPSRGGFGGVRRKKRRGLSASDIRGAQKVARLVQHFGFRPKIKARKRGR